MLATCYGVEDDKQHRPRVSRRSDTKHSAVNKLTIVLKATIRREHQMPPEHHQPHVNKGHTSTSSEVYSTSVNYLPQM